MWQFFLGLSIGGLGGVLFMALMNIASDSNRKVNALHLFIAASNLLSVCYHADAQGDLSEQIDGKYLEAVQYALDNFSEVNHNEQTTNN